MNFPAPKETPETLSELLVTTAGIFLLSCALTWALSAFYPLLPFWPTVVLVMFGPGVIRRALVPKASKRDY